MFRKKKEESIDPAQFQQFLAYQAAMKEQSDKPKRRPDKQQAKPGAKRKKRGRLRRFVLLLVIAVAGLAIAFHYFPLFFIEIYEAI